MSYTFEDFKREHPHEIVERFKEEWESRRIIKMDVRNHDGENLERFVFRAFHFALAKYGHDFWEAVAAGKHRVTDRPQFAPVKTSVPEMSEQTVTQTGAKLYIYSTEKDNPKVLDRPTYQTILKPTEDKGVNMMKKKWHAMTMRLGLWLIGGRETPHINELQKSLGDANDAFWAADRMRGYAEIARDEARASSDKHYAKLKDTLAYLDGSNSEYEKLGNYILDLRGEL